MKKPELFNMGSPRTSQYKADGTLDLDSPIGSEYDEVLDPLNDLLTGRNRSLPASRHGTPADAQDPIQTARDRQRVDRELVLFERNMVEVLRDMLAPQRILVQGAVHRGGYHWELFTINRSDGARLNVTVTVEKSPDDPAMRTRENFVRMLQRVAEQVLQARARTQH